MTSLEFVEALFRTEAVVFFEVWIDEDEDPRDVARGICALGGWAIVDPDRPVVRVFAPRSAPKGLGSS